MWRESYFLSFSFNYIFHEWVVDYIIVWEKKKHNMSKTRRYSFQEKDGKQNKSLTRNMIHKSQQTFFVHPVLPFRFVSSQETEMEEKGSSGLISFFFPVI